MDCTIHVLRDKIATLESKNRDLQNEINAKDCTIYALRIDKKSEREEDTIGMLDRRGRCERCGCAITGTGLCKKCNDIIDKEAKE